MSAVATYRYLNASTLTPGSGLALQTSGGRVANPTFFRGFLTAPQPAALGLLAVAEVARTRYFQPLLNASRDPVVTGSAERLRFESFSGCCGVYARLDVLPTGLDGETIDHGTTNVDVNQPLREALTRVGDRDPLRLDVGADEMVVSTMASSVVEKKVPLPTRWLRGFVEVQAITSGFDLRAEIPAAAAAAFLRGLPTGRDASVLWVVPAARTLRLTSRPVPGAVCLPGPGRLVALRPLLRSATSLRIYGPAVTSATAAAPSTWEVVSPTQRLTLTLSPEPRRGFSGEGAVLEALASDDVADDADLVAAMLAYDPAIDIAALSDDSGLAPARVRAALAQLGTAGQVGYDVTEAAYFHRVLPYDPSAIAKLNPRLVAARALAAAGAVAIDGGHAWVTSAEERYQVGIEAGASVSCTCAWWGRHRGDRGPCKHALAVSLVLVPEPVEVDA
jgi:hypothetical protein